MKTEYEAQDGGARQMITSYLNEKDHGATVLLVGVQHQVKIRHTQSKPRTRQQS